MKNTTSDMPSNTGMTVKMRLIVYENIRLTPFLHDGKGEDSLPSLNTNVI